jgi:hypothetical protein
MMGAVASTVHYYDVANIGRGVRVFDVDVGRTIGMDSACSASQHVYSCVARSSTYFKKVTSRLAGDALAPASTANIVRAVENSMMLWDRPLLIESLYM